jgi:UDP-glucuronate 4-epimerase
MRILVTGGAGFIGSHLSHRLLRAGHEIAIVDDLNGFYALELKQENLREVERAGAFRFFAGDICDQPLVDSICHDFAPEAIVHLAARAGVRPSLAEPLLYEQVNVHGTLVLLEAARRWGVGKFLFASSSSVYGAANVVPFREDERMLLPVSPYAASKLSAENFCYTYSHLYGLNVICLRFFTVYGPRQRPDLAIRKFAELMLAGREIPFYGDGESARDYTYVDDTVSGILAALDYPARYEVFNLGNSHPVKLRDLVKALEETLGVTARLDRRPDQPGDVPITFADIERAQRLLGYRPATPLREGLRHMAAWLRETGLGARRAAEDAG